MRSFTAALTQYIVVYLTASTNQKHWYRSRNNG